MMRLKVKSTSWAVKGSPSCHRTSCRRWKVQVRPSSEDSQDSARAGSTSLVNHEVCVSPSNRYPNTSEDEASVEMARLKVSGSEMVAKVRLPPCFPTVYSNSSAFRSSCSTTSSRDGAPPPMQAAKTIGSEARSRPGPHLGQCRVLGASGAVMPLLVKVSYEREVVFVIFSVV